MSASVPAECELWTYKIYSGTKRERATQMITPYGNLCKTHNQPLAMCVLDGLLRAERERADRLEAALGEIAETLGELARYLPELRLDEKAEARAALKEPEP